MSSSDETLAPAGGNGTPPAESGKGGGKKPIRFPTALTVLIVVWFTSFSAIGTAISRTGDRAGFNPVH